MAFTSLIVGIGVIRITFNNRAKVFYCFSVMLGIEKGRPSIIIRYPGLIRIQCNYPVPKGDRILPKRYLLYRECRIKGQEEEC